MHSVLADPYLKDIRKCRGIILHASALQTDDAFFYALYFAEVNCNGCTVMCSFEAYSLFFKPDQIGRRKTPVCQICCIRSACCGQRVTRFRLESDFFPAGKIVSFSKFLKQFF